MTNDKMPDVIYANSLGDWFYDYDGHRNKYIRSDLYDRRVTELLEANNRLVEENRVIKRENDILKKEREELAQYIMAARTPMECPDTYQLSKKVRNENGNA